MRTKTKSIERWGRTSLNEWEAVTPIGVFRIKRLFVDGGLSVFWPGKDVADDEVAGMGDALRLIRREVKDALTSKEVL